MSHPSPIFRPPDDAQPAPTTRLSRQIVAAPALHPHPHLRTCCGRPTTALPTQLCRPAAPRRAKSRPGRDCRRASPCPTGPRPDRPTGRCWLSSDHFPFRRTPLRVRPATTTTTPPQDYHLLHRSDELGYHHARVFHPAARISTPRAWTAPCGFRSKMRSYPQARCPYVDAPSSPPPPRSHHDCSRSTSTATPGTRPPRISGPVDPRCPCAGETPLPRYYLHTGTTNSRSAPRATTSLPAARSPECRTAASLQPVVESSLYPTDSCPSNSPTTMPPPHARSSPSPH